MPVAWRKKIIYFYLCKWILFTDIGTIDRHELIFYKPTILKWDSLWKWLCTSYYIFCAGYMEQTFVAGRNHDLKYHVLQEMAQSLEEPGLINWVTQNIYLNCFIISVCSLLYITTQQSHIYFYTFFAAKENTFYFHVCKNKFSACFVWLWNIVSYTEGRTLIAVAWKWSAQDNIWT
jgi:hypothetical protein